MSRFKSRTLCRYRRNEYKNVYSFEFCKVNYEEYAVFSYCKGEIKCHKIGTNYKDVKAYFIQLVQLNF